jgi:outer membrane biosynthesis protein TonB
VTGFVSRIEDARRREFRRLLGYSGVAHLLLLLAFTFSPRPGGTALPAVVRVDLVAAAPARARPAAAKPKPRPRKTVLPAQPTRAPKPAPKPEPKPEPVAKPEPAAEPQVDYDDFLEKLREEAGEAEEPVEMASAASARPGTGRGVPVTPEVMAWMRSAKVLGTRVVRRSGNPWYDESVERAIKKASPLPPPPEADEWLFVFRPEDVL